MPNTYVFMTHSPRMIHLQQIKRWAKNAGHVNWSVLKVDSLINPKHRTAVKQFFSPLRQEEEKKEGHSVNLLIVEYAPDGADKQRTVCDFINQEMKSLTELVEVKSLSGFEIEANLGFSGRSVSSLEAQEISGSLAKILGSKVPIAVYSSTSEVIDAFRASVTEQVVALRKNFSRSDHPFLGECEKQIKRHGAKLPLPQASPSSAGQPKKDEVAEEESAATASLCIAAPILALVKNPVYLARRAAGSPVCSPGSPVPTQP